MAYTVEQVIKDVRKLLDEEALDSSAFTADGQTASTEADDTELDELIRSRIVEARNFVLGGCDLALLREDCEVITRAGSPIVLDALFTGLRVVLQSTDAVLRLASVQGDTWKKAVTEFIPFEDSAYAMLHDPYSTGTPQSPKAAEGLVRYKVTPFAPELECRAVELYSWEGEELTAAEMNYALRYVKSYTLDEMTQDVYVRFEPLRAALRYYLAGLVAGILKDDRKDDFIHLATMQMGVSTGEGN